jgi:hypothetical protein
VHHLNFCSTDCRYINLVAINQCLHDKLNLMFTKFPKLCRRLSRRLPFTMNKKLLLELQSYLDIYKEINFWINVRDTIKNEGIVKAEELYGTVIYDIYKGKKQE